MDKYNMKKLSEQEFRELVKNEHLKGSFKGDPHRMQVDFKTDKNSEDFFAIAYFDGDETVAFCGLDVYKTLKGQFGMIHALGVTKNYRGKRYSTPVLLEIEKQAREKYPNISILSICNPISARSHISAGYTVTHPGRLSKTGKRMQIRLIKE